MTPPTILVTGGPSGIGRGIVEGVLGRGWTAIAVDVSEETLASFKTEMSDIGDRLICEQLDVSDEDAVNGLVDQLEADGHAISGVVNSAGIGADVPAMDTKIDLFRKIIDINLLGSFMVSQAVARHMIKRGEGSIINIASVSGMTGNTGRVAYGASKGGVLQMTRVMATELAPMGVRVNAIAPGPVNTPLVERMHQPNSRNAWEARVPMHRYGTPAEIAAGVLFLLDREQSSFVTGQTLAIDGGFMSAGIIYDSENAWPVGSMSDK